MKTPTIAVSEFVHRQVKGSGFSYFDGAWTDVQHMVETFFGNAKPGYRKGVVLVTVPPDNFYTNILMLEDGDLLLGRYKPRQFGEDPRKHYWLAGGNRIPPMPAKTVQIVLYRADVLAEDNDRSSDADWEIISINASPFESDQEIPMLPSTLIANHFGFSGGTDTKMTPWEFENALRASAIFWRDKTMIGES